MASGYAKLLRCYLTQDVLESAGEVEILLGQRSEGSESRKGGREHASKPFEVVVAVGKSWVN